MSIEAAAELVLVLRRLAIDARLHPTPLAIEVARGDRLRVFDRGQPSLSQIEHLVGREE